MLQAEFEVCTDCGNLHMEGGPAPDDVDECAVCGSRTTDVELDDLVGL
jgi:rRNA maturation endonuclease Nob1